jgi:hypothetical protein
MAKKLEKTRTYEKVEELRRILNMRRGLHQTKALIDFLGYSHYWGSSRNEEVALRAALLIHGAPNPAEVGMIYSKSTNRRLQLRQMETVGSREVV